MGAQGPKALMLSLDNFLINDQYFIFWEILHKNLDFWILFENQSSASPGVPKDNCLELNTSFLLWTGPMPLQFCHSIASGLASFSYLLARDE